VVGASGLVPVSDRPNAHKGLYYRSPNSFETHRIHFQVIGGHRDQDDAGITRVTCSGETAIQTFWPGSRGLSVPVCARTTQSPSFSR